MNNSTIDFETITTRQQISRRGGGVEIDLSTLGFEGHRMSAYQNYLGGGMLGSIQCNDTIRHAGNTQAEIMYSSETERLDEISDGLMKYMHSLTNPEDRKSNV